jgi:hypothetical protein
LRITHILRPERAGRRKKSLGIDVPIAARLALHRLLLPISAFALDAGVSVSEVNSLLRRAAVLSAASRQTEHVGRISISGIAATTGMPRAEISRILKSASNEPITYRDRSQQPTNRVLSAWGRDAKFLDSSGRPADLKIYGRGATFDSLVRNYGRGIPTRAMVDELARTGAIEVRPSMEIRMILPVSITPGITLRHIGALGECATDIYSVLPASRPKKKPGKVRRNFRRAN